MGQIHPAAYRHLDDLPPPGSGTPPAMPAPRPGQGETGGRLVSPVAAAVPEPILPQAQVPLALTPGGPIPPGQQPWLIS
jgi:hypothetical protein